VLITGMSGTGKSAALVELGRRGYRVVETDEPGWKEWQDGEEVWREQEISELLAVQDERTLYVSGCVANQGRFYDRFDAVVLLSAPAGVLLDRIESRTSNDFGKHPAERQQILSDLAEVEPLLRRTSTHELDATRPLEEIVGELIRIAKSPASP
jgi:RNase adaptor protein for sRNA GlmZ degradation